MKYYKYARSMICICLIITFFIAYYFDISHYLNLDFFKQQKIILLDFVHNHYPLAALFFIGTYTITIACSFPSAATLSLIGGFLFNVIPGIFYILLGATSGAVLSFLNARYLIGSWFQHRYQKPLASFNTELDQCGIYYLLSLRLIPVIPFFVANMMVGLTKIPLKTFIWTTVLGIIPSTFIFCFAGQQLQTIESVRDVLSTPMLSALFLLGVLALIPVYIKKIFKNRKYMV